MKTIAVIPCYNEAHHIGEVVKGVLPYVYRVLVVDNNCTDKTAEVAYLDGAHVFQCCQPGVGAATNVGIYEALKMGAEVVLTLDGDGQHYPPDIPKLVDPIYGNLADVTVGLRFFGPPMPAYRRLGNEVITAAYNFGSHLHLSDAQCGMRAFRADLPILPDLCDCGFGCIPEFLCKARKAHLRIQGILITCLYHSDFSQNSTMPPVKHGILALSRTIRWRIWEVIGR